MEGEAFPYLLFDIYREICGRVECNWMQNPHCARAGPEALQGVIDKDLQA